MRRDLRPRPPQRRQPLKGNFAAEQTSGGQVRTLGYAIVYRGSDFSPYSPSPSCLPQKGGEHTNYIASFPLPQELLRTSAAGNREPLSEEFEKLNSW